MDDKKKDIVNNKAYGTFFESEESPSIVLHSSDILSRQHSDSVPHYVIDRNAYTQVTLNEKAPKDVSCICLSKQIRTVLKRNCTCSKKCVSSFFKRLFPVLAWIPEYNLKENILIDIITGFTLAIIHIPQGMAYAHLASVPTIYGLYTSFYPVLLYFFMGTSRHISIGTFAIASMLTGVAVENIIHHEAADIEKYNRALYDNTTGDDIYNSSTVLPTRNSFPVHTNIDVAIVVTFTVGIIQTIMGLSRMGSLTTFMSDEMISAFITGTAVCVVTSQMKSLTGIKTPKYSGPFNMILTWMSLFRLISSANYVVVLLSLAAICFLVFVKEFLNVHILKRVQIPIPAELILVILGTVTSHFMNLGPNYGVEIVGTIPTGLLPPVVPQLVLLPKVLSSSIVLSVVVASTSISVIIIYAKKHKYEVDMNQELFAFGVGNLITSFFSCIPSCASLARSAVQENIGGKSQIASLVSCLLLLVVLLSLGPLFQDLPECILSAVIVVSLKSMLMYFLDLKRAWETSKIDASVWVVTFISVVVLDLDYGLIIGIVFSLITILYRSQSPEICLLGQIPGTDLYRSIAKYPAARELVGIKICHYGASIYFANRDYFKSEFLHLISLKQRILVPSLQYNKAVSEDKLILTESCYVDDIYCVILSCSAIGYVDSGGAATLLHIIKELNGSKIKVYLACVQEPVIENLKDQNFFETFPEDHIFPTIHDAVLYAELEKTRNI